MKTLVCALLAGTLACSTQASETPVQTAEAPPANESGSEAITPAAAEASPEPAKTDAAGPAGKQDCNLLLGSDTTSEWFNAGFQSIAGDRHWQAIFSPRTLVQHWADPSHAAWTKPVVSPCMHGAEAPNRVVLVVTNFDFKTKDEWLKALTSVVETLKQKYPSSTQIDLMTMFRGPNGASCGNPQNAVAPFIDAAIDNVVTNYPNLVKAAPKFELDSCAAFKKGGAGHLTEEGAAAAAKLAGDYYATDGGG